MNDNVLPRLLFLSLMMFVASCTQVAPPPNVEGQKGAAAHPTDLHGATLYRVSGRDSAVHVLVYRGGALANLGHNHVLSSPDADGFIWLHDKPELCGFELVAPVNDLIVDDNQARIAEGAEFPPNVPEDAKQGTKRNLLSEAVLDGARYPQVTIKSIAILGARGHPNIKARMTIKARTREIQLPVSWLEQDQKLLIHGEFAIKQSDFGIKPYSVALGALQVQDEIRIKFDLIALLVAS